MQINLRKTLHLPLQGALLIGAIGQLHAQSNVDSQVVDVGEAQIEVRSKGRGEVLVVPSGVGAGVSYLDAFVRTVADEGLRVLAINPRGAGDSRGPLVDLSLTDYAEDVAGVLESPNTRNATILGFGGGNRVARRLAVIQPDLVAGLVLVAACVESNLVRRRDGSLAKRKTNQTDDSVDQFIDSIENESKRDDCRAIAQLMAAATGEEPRMWGTSIVGFGKHCYQYANGKPAEICKVGFAPRARSFAFYFPKYPEHSSLIKKLGKHKYSGGCLHVTRLADVDAEVLARMIKKAYGADGRGACDVGTASS